MAILPQSRYNQGALVRVPDSSGQYNLTVFRQVPTASIPFTLYIWTEGDRVDLVSQQFYGNPALWWAIFDVNPELIDPLNVPAGTIVRIPSNPQMGEGTLVQ